MGTVSINNDFVLPRIFFDCRVASTIGCTVFPLVVLVSARRSMACETARGVSSISPASLWGA